LKAKATSSVGSALEACSGSTTGRLRRIPRWAAPRSQPEPATSTPTEVWPDTRLGRPATRPRTYSPRLDQISARPHGQHPTRGPRNSAAGSPLGLGQVLEQDGNGIWWRWACNARPCACTVTAATTAPPRPPP
jgi:hypothetical protein